MQVKKYIDTSKLSSDKLRELEKILGQDLYVQKNRSRFKKVNTPLREAINVISQKGEIFALEITNMPKYLSRTVIKNLISH